MGSHGSKAEGKKLSLSDLPDLLGEKLPEYDFSPVGRHRVVTALRNRFGNGYRNLPGVSDILKDFDQEVHFQTKLNKMKAIKGRGK